MMLPSLHSARTRWISADIIRFVFRTKINNYIRFLCLFFLLCVVHEVSISNWIIEEICDDLMQYFKGYQLALLLVLDGNIRKQDFISKIRQFLQIFSKQTINFMFASNIHNFNRSCPNVHFITSLSFTALCPFNSRRIFIPVNY